MGVEKKKAFPRKGFLRGGRQPCEAGFMPSKTVLFLLMALGAHGAGGAATAAATGGLAAFFVSYHRAYDKGKDGDEGYEDECGCYNRLN